MTQPQTPVPTSVSSSEDVESSGADVRVKLFARTDVGQVREQVLRKSGHGLLRAGDPRPHQPPGPTGTGPLVTFARSGISAPFGGGVSSVLELADACDVPSRWSCRTGVCHTCVTPLLSGDISYTPEPLEPPADGQVLICCAQPDTDIVVDM